jgi:hypothetical protein
LCIRDWYDVVLQVSRQPAGKSEKPALTVILGTWDRRRKKLAADR